MSLGSGIDLPWICLVRGSLVGPYLRPAPGASKSGSALLDSAARQNDDAGAKSDDSANDGRREAELDEANGAVGAWTMRPMTSPTTAPTMPTEAAPTTAHRPAAAGHLATSRSCS